MTREEAYELLDVIVKESKRGEWHTKPNPNYSPFDSTSEVIYMCSQCAYSSGDRIASTWNFCPNCGADMRTQNDRSWDTSERGVSGSVKNSIAQKEGEAE